MLLRYCGLPLFAWLFDHFVNSHTYEGARSWPENQGCISCVGRPLLFLTILLVILIILIILITLIILIILLILLILIILIILKKLWLFWRRCVPLGWGGRAPSKQGRSPRCESIYTTNYFFASSKKVFIVKIFLKNLSLFRIYFQDIFFLIVTGILPHAHF